MRMLIANNCLTIHVYHKQQRQYDNPFFGNRIFCKDFQKLIENFETLDYEYVDICLNDDLHHTDPVGTPNKTISVILPGKIRVLYQHIMYSKTDIVPRKVSGCVYYHRNYELALNNYLRRVKRMNVHANKLFIYLPPNYNATSYLFFLKSQILRFGKKCKFLLPFYHN